jgi:integrase
MRFVRPLAPLSLLLIPHAHLVARPDAARRLRWLEMVRRAGRERHYSERTIAAYVHWIRRYVIHFGRRHPRDLGSEHAREFLSYLANDQRVAASTQNQAAAALNFLYVGVLHAPFDRLQGVTPARVPQRVPTVLSEREVGRVLRQLEGIPRLAVLLMYGSGLRVLECLTLRVKDIDFDRREVTVRGGKGGKDRRAPLAVSALAPLKRYLRERQRVHYRDLRLGVHCTGLSPALERKYPRAIGSWSWSYVFPASRTFVDAAGVRRRHHVHVTVVHRAITRRARGSSYEAGNLSCLSTFVRNALTRVRRRHSHDPGAPRPHRRSHDDDLYACAESRWPRRYQPSGSARALMELAELAELVRLSESVRPCCGRDVPRVSSGHLGPW